jgi:hypothetical protein
MAKKIGENGSVVKIDSVLLEKVEEFIEDEENRLKFVNKKQFIDLAVNDFLKKMEKGK